MFARFGMLDLQTDGIILRREGERHQARRGLSGTADILDPRALSTDAMILKHSGSQPILPQSRSAGGRAVDQFGLSHLGSRMPSGKAGSTIARSSW